MQVGKYFGFIALAMYCLQVAAADTARVNKLNYYIYEQWSTCSQVSSDSLNTLKKLELSKEQKNIARFNFSQKLYCNKKYHEALNIIDSLAQNPLNEFVSFKARVQFQKGKLLWAMQQYDAALLAFDNNIVFSKLIVAQKIEGLCQYYKGRIFETRLDYLQAIKSYEAAIEPLKKSKRKFVGEIYKSIGIVYRKMGLNTEAIEQYNIALDYYISTEYDFGIASIYNSMANILVVECNFAKAEEYFNKALEYNKRIEDGRSIELNITNNFGVLYIKNEQYALAIPVLQKALEMAKTQKNKAEASVAIGNLAIAYKGTGAYEKSIDYYHKALKMKGFDAANPTSAQNILGLGNAHFRNGNSDSAYYFYKNIEPHLATYVNSTFLVTYYHYLSDYYKSQKEWPKAIAALDSMFSVTNRSNKSDQRNLLASYSMLFNTKAKEYENAMLEKSIETEKEKVLLAQNRAKTKNLLLIFSLSAFVVISVFAVLLVINRRKLEEINGKLNQLNESLQLSLDENKALLGIVAHDLKTPINQFKGLIELMKDAGDLNDEQLNYVDVMETVANNGNIIVQDLLLANREEALLIDLKNINVCRLLNLAKGRFISQLKAKNMTLNIDCAADFNVLADESGLNRVLDNLISNAIKFSNAAASITIHARVQNGIKEIAIIDTGLGIAENEMHKLFKRYAKLSARPTSGESSTGLGLFIVKTLLEKMNASIKVDSKLGEGSTFTIVFHA